MGREANVTPSNPVSEQKPANDLAPGSNIDARPGQDDPIRIPETRLDTVTPSETSIEGNDGREVKEEDSGLGHSSFALGLAFWAAIGGIVAWNTPEGRDLITRFWWVAAAGVGALLTALAFPRVRERISKATPRSRDAMLSFVIVSMLLLVVGTVVFMPDRYQVPVLRSIFLVIVCLLPASMWYLFLCHIVCDTPVDSLEFLDVGVDAALEHRFLDRLIWVMTSIE